MVGLVSGLVIIGIIVVIMVYACILASEDDYFIPMDDDIPEEDLDDRR